MLSSFLVIFGGVTASLSAILTAVSATTNKAAEQNQGRILAGIALVPFAVSALGLLNPEIFSKVQALNTHGQATSLSHFY